MIFSSIWINLNLINISKEKYRLDFGDQTIFNDGNSQWLFLKELNEIQIIDHDEEDETMNFLKLFSDYEDKYKYSKGEG